MNKTKQLKSSSNPVNVTLNNSEGILTITDNDNAPTISIADTTIPNENAVIRTTAVTLAHLKRLLQYNTPPPMELRQLLMITYQQLAL